MAIDEAGADLSARTSSGTIRIGAAKGRVSANNSGGGIKLGQAQGSVEAETSSGDISAGFSGLPTGDSRLQVSGGGIQIALPQNAALDLDAHANGGKVASELPVTVTVHDSRNSGSLQGKINGGGPKLLLRTSSGDIRLKKAAPADTPVEAEAPEK